MRAPRPRVNKSKRSDFVGLGTERRRNGLYRVDVRSFFSINSGPSTLTCEKQKMKFGLFGTLLRAAGTSAFLIGMSSAASAVTINFEALASDAQPYVESGYEFSATSFGSVRPTTFLAGATTGNTSVFPSVGFDDHGILMTRIGGGEFDLFSFDVGEPFSLASFPGTNNFRITGTRADTTQITTTFLVDGISGFQTFNAAGFTSLVSLLFQSDGTSSADENRSIDNIVVAASAAVPAPATALIFGLSLIGLGTIRRRKSDG
jgi:hypothetical protein